MNIRKIIKEEINRYINESLSSIIYHFTTIDGLLGILESNSFMLSDGLRNKLERKINKGFPYYISFTRQKHGRIGYSLGLEVRITFDGERLNNNFKSSPVDYMKLLDTNNDRTETEDRLFSDKEFINDIDKYILRIDTYDAYKDDIVDALNNGKINNKLISKIYIYDDQDDFIYGNNKAYRLIDIIKKH